MDRKKKETVWSNWNEFKSCYQLLFQSKAMEKVIDISYDTLDLYINMLNINDLVAGLNILRINNIRNDDLSFILPSLLITEEIIRFKSGQYNISDSSDYAHILGQKIIRVVNIIVDNFKKKSKKNKYNMFLAANEINFPDFLIEIRHACTHKNLPSFLTLMYCIKYLFLWIKFNMWDKQYILVLDNEKLFHDTKQIIELLSSKENVKDVCSKLEQFISFKKPIKFEYTQYSQLFILVKAFFESFINQCSITSFNKTVANEKINDFASLYKLLQKLEKFKIIVLFFKIIQEKISKFIHKTLSQASDQENEDNLFKYSFFLVFTLTFIEEDVLSNMVKSRYIQVLRKIYVNLRFAKDFNYIIHEIYEKFVGFILKRFEINLDYPQFDCISKRYTYKQQVLEETTKLEDLVLKREDLMSSEKNFHIPGTLLTKQIKALIEGPSTEKNNKIKYLSNEIDTMDTKDINTSKDIEEFMNFKETQYMYFKN